MTNNLGLVGILKFGPALAELLPDTNALLSSANLAVHPSVSKIVLHGSRGLAGGCRPNSDIDLSLLVDVQQGQTSESLFLDVTKATLDHWQAAIEIDLAVIFDRKKCGLKCFEHATWDQDFCQLGGMDCFGLCKIQNGLNGMVTNAGIQVRLMVPYLKIWQRVHNH